MGSERVPKTTDVTQKEICRSNDVISVRVKRKSAIENDTETDDLKERVELLMDIEKLLDLERVEGVPTKRTSVLELLSLRKLDQNQE